MFRVILEVFLRSCWGYFHEPFWIPKKCSRTKQNAAGAGRRRTECGRILSRPKVSPHPYTDGRISCRKGLETPLAAGLAAGAGGLGSLEALAVHPWAQEF